MTRMLSETPGTPGTRQQDAAHVDVDLHAGAGRLYSFSIDFWSTSEFIFSATRAGLPSRRAAIARSTSASRPSRRCCGATRTLRKRLGRAKPGQHVEQVGGVGADALVAGEEAEVGVEPGRLGVVVARADGT